MDRTEKYRKKSFAEDILDMINRALSEIEREVVVQFDKPKYPTLFIIGAPHSGSTLMSQLIVNSYEIGYINNIAARFWEAPFIGSWLSRECRGSRFEPEMDFMSDLGMTSGYDGPHEYGYFWRRWFDYAESHDVAKDRLDRIDKQFLVKEIAAVESVYDKPIFFKNLVCSFQVGFLSEVMEKSLFIHCRRDPVFVAQALLKSRQKYFGSKHAWFSLKPAEYPDLKKREYAEQIVGQIYYTRKKIENSFERLDSSRHITIDYETLCTDTAGEIERIRNLFISNGYSLKSRQFNAPALTVFNEKRIDDEEFEKLSAQCDRYFAAGD